MANHNRTPHKVIIDTDIGTDVDDAIAIAFALRRPELDVQAITTTRYMPEQRAAIVAKLLKVTGRTDVPFAAGSRVLFNGQPYQDKPVNQYAFAEHDDDLPAAACDDGMALLRQTIEANWGDVWLVTIGPMTNTAMLLRDQPELVQGLKGVVCMAGEPTRPHCETNILRDPEAAAAVCKSGLLKFVGTYDVTRRVRMTDAHLAQLREATTPLTRAIVELITLWRATVDREHPVVFDMCPLVWLFEPQRFTTTPMGLEVDLTPEQLSHVRPCVDAPVAEVTTDIDEMALLEMLMATLINESQIDSKDSQR